MKRTIYIGNPAYLKLKYNQMEVVEPRNKEVKGSVPIEDMGLLMLDNNQITLSNQLIVKLQKNNVAIITCDQHHLPFGIMLPFYGHTEHSERIKYQLEASEPLKKQLWKQTVEQKILNQRNLLIKFDRPYKKMDDYRKKVMSGDPTNMEGKAARFYWNNLWQGFIRDRFGEAPNNLLNFGYSVLRSTIARALVGSGLYPTLGIFHRNKYNPYCLADDIMEPYRPYIDKLVYEYLLLNNNTDLDKEIKAHILKIATQDVIIENKNRPLMVSVSISTSSLFKCYKGELKKIKYPELKGS